MTTDRGRSPIPGGLLAALLTVGFALCAIGPAQAGQVPPARHHGSHGSHHDHGNHDSSAPPATAEIIDSTAAGGKAVALTFDDGPDPRNTPELLDVLSEHSTKAVFCLWGDHVQQHPGIVRSIADAGHTLCNHTMAHEDLSSWSAADIRANIQATNEAIRAAVPGADIPYFRAPYGAWGQSPQVAADLGMQPLGWSLSVEDWVPPGTEELVRRLEEGITPRSVVLLHDGGGDRSQTVAAVDRIIPRLRDDGWRFVHPARGSAVPPEKRPRAAAGTGAAPAAGSPRPRYPRPVRRSPLPCARRLAAVLAGALLMLCAGTAPGAAAPGGQAGHRGWVGTWATAPTTAPESATPVLQDETIRQVVHTSVGGGRIRLRLTNEFGKTPLRIGEVRVALRADSAEGSSTDIDPRTDRPVTFGGRTSVTVPAGAPMLSDPVRFRLPPRSDLVVSIHVPERTPVTTLHAFSYQENAVAAGNATAETSVSATRTLTRWHFLSGVSVRARGKHTGAVVALGDSITDGAESTVNADNRWPDLLAERLGHTGVLNAGISGNRLLHDPNPPEGSDAEAYAAFFGPSALRRFDRDVLSRPGAEHVIVLLGVNDLGHPGTSAPESETVTAEEIINGHRRLIARAHAAGLRVYGGTILPFKGDTFGFYSEENEAKRQAVNKWIRTSGEYDAVIDFARVMRDPEDPQRLRPEYDSGDHLHPDDAGMRAMADAVPIGLFGPGHPWRP